MTPEDKEAIKLLLERKRQIDMTPTGRFVATDRWLAEAVELLLKLALRSEGRES
jgi:hypothetical protein